MGFFLGYRFLNPLGPSLWISLTHKTPSNDRKTLLEVVFDKTAFVVNFKISNNFKQKIDETYSKQPKTNPYENPYQPMVFLKI